MGDLTFRKAIPSDVPSVLALVRSAYRPSGEASRDGWTTEVDLVADDRIDEAGLLAKFNQPGGQVLLTFYSSTSALLACCEILRNPEPSESAHFGLFAVSPKLQNGGIGRKVMAEAERCAKDEMGAKVMEMQVLWMRSELIAWYERRGYRVIEGETKPFPIEHLINPRAGESRDDLYFQILRKHLA